MSRPPHFRLDFLRHGSVSLTVQTDPPINPDNAHEAAVALLVVITDLLEFTVDQCALENAVERLPSIADLCRDTAVLADASAVILRRSQP